MRRPDLDFSVPDSRGYNVVVHALVTGVTGFLGQHLARALHARRLDFTGVSRRARVSSTGDMRPLDLHDQAGVQALLDEVRPTHVFHLAASLRTPGQDAESLIRSNVTATQHFMEVLARRDDAPVLVLPSSAAVYGRPQELPITESHPVAPLELYGVTKAAQELIMEQYHRTWGCPIRILRVFNMIGPGQPTSLVAGSIAYQIARVERGEQAKIEVGDLSTKRDLVDARDVAAACIDAALHDAGRLVLNVCSGVSTRTQDCVDQLRAASPASIKLVRRDKRLRHNDLADHRGDPDLILRTLGWRPTVPVRDSMADLMAYWRQRVAEGNGP
jgi:GDP-4-dehydro-6-deoxy-D-mannose reductase